MPVSVVTINSLVFETIDSTLDTNPNTGGGNRIYPEKSTPSDATNRKRIRVKATLSAAIDDIDIYFKSFDLDDPSANSGPVDSNGSSGGDNRGNIPNGILSQINTSGSTNTATVISNSSGIAQADFLVTTHPGDNFMVGASGDPNITSGLQIDGITLEDSGGTTLPITKAKATPMLTVWRKIHLEIDNMSTVSGNSVIGLVNDGLVGNGTTFLFDNNSFDYNRFENGRLSIAGDGFDVLYNDSGTIIIDGEHDIGSLIDHEYTMVDDDDYDNDDSPNSGDSGEGSILALNALTTMQASDNPSLNVFAPAYIMPAYDGGGNMANNGTATFAVNVAAGQLGSQLVNHWGTNGQGNNDFWIGYIQVGYQPDVSVDGDPGLASIGVPTTHTLGVAPALTANSVSANCSGLAQGGYSVLIFQETQRDWFNLNSVSNDNTTAPHELGHIFGLGHLGSSIMSDGGYNLTNFDPEHIHMLRCRVKSPGYN